MTNSKKLLFAVIMFAGCFGSIASDIYSPSLPAIADYFGTTNDIIQFSMAIFMFGLGAGQLFFGPLSEGYGRKKVLIIGLLIALVGSLCCLFAPNIYVLLLGRLVQGIGASSGAVLWRAVFRDSFSGDELAKYTSYLAIFVAFFIPAAPMIGGFLQDTFNWQASFVFLIIYIIGTLVLIQTGFNETASAYSKDKLKWAVVRSSFGELLGDRMLVGMAICSFLSYGAYFSWFVVGPVLLIDNLGFAPSSFGIISFWGGAFSVLVSGIINSRLVVKYGAIAMLRVGWITMITSSILMAVSYLLLGVHAISIVFSIIVFFSGVYFTFPNAFALAIKNSGHLAGYAAAIYGTLQVLGAAILGALIAYLPDSNQLPLALVMFASPALSWLLYLGFIKKETAMNG